MIMTITMILILMMTISISNHDTPTQTKVVMMMTKMGTLMMIKHLLCWPQGYDDHDIHDNLDDNFHK